MCIIAVKEKGVEISDATIKTMFERNKDGAGFAVWKDGKGATASKGYMTVDAFLTDYKKAVKKEDSAILHFRITTHGTHAKEQCHPFPVTDNIEMLEATAFRARGGYILAHNGVFSSLSIGKEYSDTQAFCALIAAPLARAFKGNLFNPDALRILERASTGSRLAVMDAATGEIKRCGDWQKDGGAYYSNGTFKPYTYLTGAGGYYGGNFYRFFDGVKLHDGEYTGIESAGGRDIYYIPDLDALFVKFKYSDAAYESISGKLSVDEKTLLTRPLVRVRLYIDDLAYYD